MPILCHKSFTENYLIKQCNGITAICISKKKLLIGCNRSARQFRCEMQGSLFIVCHCRLKSIMFSIVQTTHLSHWQTRSTLDVNHTHVFKHSRPSLRQKRACSFSNNLKQRKVRQLVQNLKGHFHRMEVYAARKQVARREKEKEEKQPCQLEQTLPKKATGKKKKSSSHV